MGTRHALAVAMVLALSRYDACSCAGPSGQPPDEPAVPVPDPCDEDTTDAVPTVHEPEDDAGPSWERRSIPYELRAGGTEVRRRFGIRGPQRLDVVDHCEGDRSCVLANAWWRGPGSYVFWAVDPAHGKREVEVELIGDELEVSFDGVGGMLFVAHPMEGVELALADGPGHPLTLINRTDRALHGVAQYNGAPFVDLVRTGPVGWADAPVRPELDCGTGFEVVTVAPATSVPLGPVESGVGLLVGSLDADTVVVRFWPDDVARATRGGDGMWIVRNSVATIPLPAELMAARERQHERMARRAARRRHPSP